MMRLAALLYPSKVVITMALMACLDLTGAIVKHSYYFIG